MGQGLVAIKTPQEVTEDEEARLEEIRNEGREEPVLLDLAAYVRRCWGEARHANQEVQQRMLRNLRMRQGKYDPQKLAAIQAQGRSDVFMMLTDIKCRAAKAWLHDILLSSGERPYAIEPSDVPEVPPHIAQQIAEFVRQEAAQAVYSGMYVQTQQVYERFRRMRDELREKVREEAKVRAERMEDEIEDVLEQGQWYRVMSEVLDDLVCYPSAILRGPVIRSQRRIAYRQGLDGMWDAVAEDELAPVFYRVSPFDFYPSPNSRNVNDGYLCERHQVRRRDLYRMIGLDGYDDLAIRRALREYEKGQLTEMWAFPDSERAELENRPEWRRGEGMIDAVEFTGPVRGEWLRNWGMTAEEIPDSDEEYEANVWLIGEHVIRAVLNDDPMLARNYHVESFDRVNGAIWGNAPPDLMVDCQTVCNAAARALIDNMGIASGPLVEVETDRLADGEQVESLYPWRITQTVSDPRGGSRNAVNFHQPDPIADVLMKVYEYFSRLADEYTGIPAYTYGTVGGEGAASTASGLAMLMNAAGRTMKNILARVDEGIIEPSVRMVHQHLMLFSPKKDIKGDDRVVTRGSTALVAREQQQMRLNELLGATNNPADLQVMGLEGRAELLRAAIRGMDLPGSEIIPDPDELKRRAMQQAQEELQQSAQQQPKPKEQNLAGGKAGGERMV